MKLKTKLLIAFFTIILVPVGMFYMSIQMLGTLQSRALEKAYGIQGVDSIFDGSSSIQIFDSITKSTMEKIRQAAQTDPEAVQEERFWESINNELKVKYSYLVIRQGDEIVYTGKDLMSELLRNQLLEMQVDTSQEGSYYTGEKTQCLVKVYGFEFSDGQDGTFMIVTPASEILPEVKAMTADLAFTVIMILFITAMLLMAWIYGSILRPISQLQKATREIKEGNLDFSLEIKEKDEIGQLCMDFEDMRVRLKESTEEKLKYDQENKELISNISHDLKTPITAIKGYVEGIMDGVASSPEKLDKYIRTIYNKANDMDKLIDELTFYSKIDTNKIPYTFKKINVKSYFSDCAEELGLELEAKGIELGYFNYADDDVVIIADAEQLKRVVNNIISNSVKYLDKKKGIINIRIKDIGDFIQVEIEDNGKGIAQKDLPYIFDRFYRTDSSRNSSKGGSGIGLSIVRKIIEDHGGKIWATSREATGTVMHFVLRKYQEVINE